MKLIVSISKPNQGVTLATVEIEDPEDGDIVSIVSNALKAARLAAPGKVWPLRIDISQATQ